MPKNTYKNLFTLVDEQIFKRLNYSTSKAYSGQLSRTSIRPLMSNAYSDIAIADLITAVQDLLRQTIPSIIINGLTVEATDPVSDAVTVKAGKCSKGGRIFEIEEDTTLPIPLNNYNSVFYINIYLNGIEIETNEHEDKVTIAKIIVPEPGTTTKIKNNKNDDYPWDAYIINFKEYKLYGDGYGNLEEDSIEILRDNLRYIVSDNLIGNIKLSENLKIINTQGTLELNSDSILIKNIDGDVLGKFNREGTFFYDNNGIEIAKFSVDGAKVGNIVITKNSIESGDFVSGKLGAGFQILDSGSAEFNDISVRGKLTNTVFEKDTISVIGGNLLVMDGDRLEVDMTALDNSTLTISGDTTFAVNDILRIKDGIDDEWFQVTNIDSAPTYIVSRDKEGAYSTNNNPVWKKGTSVVNFGASNEGGIFMTASESNAPYVSIVTHAGSPWDTLTTHLRLGNLNGFLGYSSDLYGIAIGTTNDYLKYDPTNGLQIKGNITITGGNASVTFYQTSEPSGEGEKDGDYWVDTDDDNALYVYESGWQSVSSGGGITSFRRSSIPTAENTGDLWIDTDDNKLYRATNEGDDEITAGEWELQNAAIATGWAHGDDVTKIDGGTIFTNTIIAGAINVTTLSAITANLGTITAGTVTGATLRTASSGSRVLMNTTNLIAYDDAAGTILNVILSGADVGDVIIGDYDSTKGLLWDKSESTFNIKGVITTTSGTFTGTVNVGAAGKVYIDGANEVIKIYDESSNLRVELGKLA